MATATQQQQVTSVATRYASMSAQEFRKVSEQSWDALTEIREVIAQHVEQGNLKPIDAVKSLACLTGSIFGYEEFHPRGPQQEMLQSLLWNAQGKQPQQSQS